MQLNWRRSPIYTGNCAAAIGGPTLAHRLSGMVIPVPIYIRVEVSPVPEVPSACFARGRVLGVRAISTNFRHNEQIRISPIFLINAQDEKVGSVSTAEALKMAREAGLDLVEVAPTARPPVCRIMDYGKWRYQQQKKEDRSRASSRAGQLK